MLIIKKIFIIIFFFFLTLWQISFYHSLLPLTFIFFIVFVYNKWDFAIKVYLLESILFYELFSADILFFYLLLFTLIAFILYFLMFRVFINKNYLSLVFLSFIITIIYKVLFNIFIIIENFLFFKNIPYNWNFWHWSILSNIFILLVLSFLADKYVKYIYIYAKS